MKAIFANELRHYGTKGQKWGVRNYQNEDGTLTEAGRLHYGHGGVDDATLQKEVSRMELENRYNRAYLSRLQDERTYNKIMEEEADENAPAHVKLAKAMVEVGKNSAKKVAEETTTKVAEYAVNAALKNITGVDFKIGKGEKEEDKKEEKKENKKENKKESEPEHVKATKVTVEGEGNSHRRRNTETIYDAQYTVEDAEPSTSTSLALIRHSAYLCHHGIKGQKWGVRRYQNPDGSLTAEGKKQYRSDKSKRWSLEFDASYSRDTLAAYEQAYNKKQAQVYRTKNEKVKAKRQKEANALKEGKDEWTEINRNRVQALEKHVDSMVSKYGDKKVRELKTRYTESGEKYMARTLRTASHTGAITLGKSSYKDENGEKQYRYDAYEFHAY